MKKMKIQYIKLNNTSTEPYVLFSETMRLLKKGGIIAEVILACQSQINTSLINNV